MNMCVNVFGLIRQIRICRYIQMYTHTYVYMRLMRVPLFLPGVQEFAEYRNVLLATPIEDDFGSDILDTHEEPLTSLFNRPTTIILETLADENKVGHTVKCVRVCVCACMRVCVHAYVCAYVYVLHMSAMSQLPMGGKEGQLVVHVECRCMYVHGYNPRCMYAYVVCSKYVRMLVLSLHSHCLFSILSLCHSDTVPL